MQLKTILNHVTDYKSFVFGNVTWQDQELRSTLEIEVKPRANGRRICSGCQQVRPGYDTLPGPRRFDFVPLWGIAICLVYQMRRVNCPECGIKVEQVPWSDGKSRTTKEYKCFLAKWARRMSWKEVAMAFSVSWECVYESVKHAVSWGLAQRELENIETIGVDEVQWSRGHKYQTVVYQIDQHCKRLLWIGPDRKADTLRNFFDFLGKSRTDRLQFICSDMWQGYLTVIAERAAGAIHILDRFHVMQMFGRALDKVRAAEVKQLKADGYEPILKGSRWLLLKRPENLTARQTVKLKELLQYNLQSVRAHIMKEDFQRFWTYSSAAWASKFLDAWCTRSMRSRIEPMKKLAHTLRDKRGLILNWFQAGGTVSSGTVEGFNNKLKLITRKSYGFRTQNGYETALYHNLADLPLPETTHKFC
jgi:transposase